MAHEPSRRLMTYMALGNAHRGDDADAGHTNEAEACSSAAEASSTACANVLRAWTVEGIAPGYHRAWQDKLRQEWPVLARALDRLARDAARR